MGGGECDGGTHWGKVRVSAAKQMVRSRDSALGHGGPWSHRGRDG